MKENPIEKNVIKISLICLLIGLVGGLLEGCDAKGYRIPQSCETHADCEKDEICFDDGGILANKHCKENPLYEDYEPINESNETRMNYTFLPGMFNKPEGEEIPTDTYHQITIYETVCECIGNSWCGNFGCECEEHCYNRSKDIWVPIE